MELPLSAAPALSVIIPIFNEEESIPFLQSKLFKVLDTLPNRFEVIAVNDGSRDRSAEELLKVARQRPEFKIVNFRQNAGQTAAMMAGIDYASGDVIITIDADLQNDPEDIPLLLSKLAEGNDVVSGWRKDRKDAAIRRNLTSRIANRFISWISGVKLHDYGCTLKAYRKEVLSGMRLYGEMHRFVPIYASWMGAKVVEVPVRHHARQFGQSKYGLERTIKVVLDLLVVKFMSRYLVKPIYVFGGFGAVSLLSAFVVFSYMVYLKYFEGIYMIQTPLPVLSGLLVLISVISVLMGFLAEINMRTYFESQNRTPYSVRDAVNFDKKP
jgi:glycosyltransferase involved in cell wall biosynthesis